jgi:Pyridoxamine 5''-phosphate oxidase.
MDKLEQFWEAIKKDMTITLATAAEGRVTMRVVSPVYYEGAILIFTSPNSKKYKQLRANPNCCIAARGFFAEATAEFRGATMLTENKALRDSYREKFPGAFAEGDEFGGMNDEFVLMHPARLSGWAFENDIQTENGVPTVPFEISI